MKILKFPGDRTIYLAAFRGLSFKIPNPTKKVSETMSIFDKDDENQTNNEHEFPKVDDDEVPPSVDLKVVEEDNGNTTFVEKGNPDAWIETDTVVELGNS